MKWWSQICHLCEATRAYSACSIVLPGIYEKEREKHMKNGSKVMKSKIAFFSILLLTLNGGQARITEAPFLWCSLEIALQSSFKQAPKVNWEWMKVATAQF